MKAHILGMLYCDGPDDEPSGEVVGYFVARTVVGARQQDRAMLLVRLRDGRLWETEANDATLLPPKAHTFRTCPYCGPGHPDHEFDPGGGECPVSGCGCIGGH